MLVIDFSLFSIASEWVFIAFHGYSLILNGCALIFIDSGRAGGAGGPPMGSSNGLGKGGLGVHSGGPPPQTLLVSLGGLRPPDPLVSLGGLRPPDPPLGSSSGDFSLMFIDVH